jgi:hypothetical protein
MSQEQNYGNHTRWYPFGHFFIAPILLLNLVYQAYALYRNYEYTHVWLVVMSFMLVCMHVAARLQALKAQDRVIRLEERLRYRELLSPELARKASELPAGMIVAMRFASDAELQDIAEAAVSGKFESSKALKQAIKNWKADHHRV